MLRKLSLLMAACLLLAPALALSAPGHGERHVHRWHGYGFLPGYHQPPSNSVPIYRKPAADDSPAYTPSYWYGGGRYYFGNPGFLHNRYNGGSFGPCWTWTPIGPIWNCG